MVLGQAYDLFITDRKINGCTPKTLAFYNDSAGAFVRFAATTATDAAVTSVADYVTPFFLSLQERNLSDTTRHTYWRGVRSFMRFLHEEGYVLDEVRLPKIRCPATTIKPLSHNEVKRVLRAFDTNRFTDLRNRMIVHLLIDTGLRLSELVGIELPHINLEEGFIFVAGKGGKERWIPFGSSTKKLLWGYIKKRGDIAAPTEERLLITEKGQPLSTRGVQVMFRRLANVVRIDGVRLSPHTLRHSFALLYIENGGDPFSLQRILGHSTQAMTAKYINMARANIKAQHNRYSPGDRLQSS